MNESVKTWKPFLQRWVITTLGVLVAANIVRGIRYDTLTGLFAASLLLGILNAFLKPVMLVLSLPLLVASLGFFALFINAFLLFVVGQLVKSFHVESFGAAFWGGLLISVVSIATNALLGTPDSRILIRRSRRQDRSRGGGGGPVIDV